jgi:hypothetical protein
MRDGFEKGRGPVSGNEQVGRIKKAFTANFVRTTFRLVLIRPDFLK